MKFTLIATVRNEVGTIRDFIESLLSQKRLPEEILIVDGASTDGTCEILEDYSSRGALRVISRPCNIAEGRNIAIANAQHDHIAVTDAGCLVDPDWLKELEACFRSNPNVDVVAGNYRFDFYTPFEESLVLATDHPDRETGEQARYYPSSRSIAFKKSAWEAVKGYPEWLYAAEDTLFNIRLRELGFEFVFCPQAIVRWRPRTSVRPMVRQFFNYARGNGRVGIATTGYLTNLQNHGLSLAFFTLSVWKGLFAFAGLGVLVLHIHRHLWSQARIAATRSKTAGMRWRVLAIMELVRIVGMAGFLAGRYDRWRKPSFVQAQKDWMGISTLDDAPPASRRRRET